MKVYPNIYFKLLGKLSEWHTIDKILRKHKRIVKRQYVLIVKQYHSSQRLYWRITMP